MSRVPIPRSRTDPFWRYTRPRLIIKIEGSGNGIKTVLVNLEDVALALHINPEYCHKYYGMELGAQARTEKKGATRYIVNGAHQSVQLDNVLDKFIETFVLCPKCELPEVRLSASKKEVRMDCNSCGNHTPVHSSHKLVTYILKNPPNAKSTVGGADTADGERGGSGSASPVNGEEGGDDLEKKDKKEKDKKSEKRDGKKKSKESKDGKEGKSKKGGKKESKDDGKSKSKGKSKKDSTDEETSPKKNKTADEEDEGEWFCDTSKEAQRARQAEELEQMKSPAVAAAVVVTAPTKRDTPAPTPRLPLPAGAGSGTAKKEESAIDSAIGCMHTFLATGSPTPEMIAAEVRRLQLARGFDASTRVQVLLRALLPAQHAQYTAQLRTHASAIKKSAVDGHAAPGVLLDAVEQTIHAQELSKLTPHILQTLYDADVLTEQQVLSWGDSPAESSSLPRDAAILIRAKAQPFLTWLKEAEEED